MIFMCPFIIGDNMNDEYYMNIALKEAEKAYKKNEIPVGCVIVKDNNIIAKGHYLKESKQNTIKHAEMIAIEKASNKLNNWRLLGTTIYITMLPCPMCASAINQSRISKVVYGTVPDNVNYDLINQILNDKKYGLPVKVVDNVLNEKCTEIVKKFFQKKR